MLQQARWTHAENSAIIEIRKACRKIDNGMRDLLSRIGKTPPNVEETWQNTSSEKLKIFQKARGSQCRQDGGPSPSSERAAKFMRWPIGARTKAHRYVRASWWSKRA